MRGQEERAFSNIFPLKFDGTDRQCRPKMCDLLKKAGLQNLKAD